MPLRLCHVNKTQLLIKCSGHMVCNKHRSYYTCTAISVLFYLLTWQSGTWCLWQPVDLLHGCHSAAARPSPRELLPRGINYHRRPWKKIPALYIYKCILLCVGIFRSIQSSRVLHRIPGQQLHSYEVLRPPPSPSSSECVHREVIYFLSSANES